MQSPVRHCKSNLSFIVLIIIIVQFCFYNIFEINDSKKEISFISTKLLNNTLIAEHFEKGSLLTFKRFLRDTFNLLNLYDLSAKYWT